MIKAFATVTLPIPAIVYKPVMEIKNGGEVTAHGCAWFGFDGKIQLPIEIKEVHYNGADITGLFNANYTTLREMVTGALVAKLQDAHAEQVQEEVDEADDAN